MLNVCLLGGVSFSVDGAVIRSDLGPAGRLLACYLFEFMGRVHRRERLADLFWGGIDPDKAKSALNTAIWRIRKILDSSGRGSARHLITLGDDVILERSPSIHVDTHQLEVACKSILGRNYEPEHVGSVVERYAGPFLDGYDGDWVVQERERLHCLFIRSTFELMRVTAMQCKYEEALEFGRRILNADSLRESVQRNVMLLLVLNGQRAEAIRTYQRLVHLLKSELDIDPMPETKRLYGDIVSGSVFTNAHYHLSAEFGTSASQP